MAIMPIPSKYAARTHRGAAGAQSCQYGASSGEYAFWLIP